VNAGDLLHAEVASGSVLGLAAKQYMDASKTVPDKFFLEVVGKRLSQKDTQVHGWLLDGFPHTNKQV
jgi:adenylate kinase family enzyme